MGSALDRRKVLFRVDSSAEIGSGHVTRCLVLADALRRRGAEPHFACRDLPGNVSFLVPGARFPLHLLPPPDGPFTPSAGGPPHAPWLGVTWERDAEETARFSAELAPEWLVTDHYGLDARWEERLSPPSGKVLVVDDLADRRHACRLLLDQGYRAGGGDPYGPLVPPGCRRLLGPRFALLRPEFAEARRTARERDGSVRRILVFLGGADPRDATGTVLEGVGAAALPGVQVDAVVGGAYAHREKAARFCASRPGWRLHVQTSEMAALMAAADLAVGGGGTATWERCFLGLPALAAVLADNQEGITAAVAAAGAQVDLGRIDALTPERVAREVEALASDPERLRTMGRAASALLPPESFEGADGVVRAMEEA